MTPRPMKVTLAIFQKSFVCDVISLELVSLTACPFRRRMSPLHGPQWNRSWWHCELFLPECETTSLGPKGPLAFRPARSQQFLPKCNRLRHPDVYVDLTTPRAEIQRRPS